MVSSVAHRGDRGSSDGEQHSIYIAFCGSYIVRPKTHVVFECIECCL